MLLKQRFRSCWLASFQRRIDDERRCADGPGRKTDWAVFASHPRERFLVRLGTGSTGSENGRDDGGRYPQTDGTGPGKRSRDRGSCWIEDEPHRQDDGFLEGHERFRNDE